MAILQDAKPKCATPRTALPRPLASPRPVRRRQLEAIRITDETAVSVGSEAFVEICVFVVAGGLLTFEMTRKTIKAKRAEEDLQSRIAKVYTLPGNPDTRLL